MEGWWQSQVSLPITIYWTIHAGCLVAIWTGVTSFEIALCLVAILETEICFASER